ncbi:WD40 repeat-like protein [Dendrothele bispora CBS 962.96]|uniref:WD40 repeat-like protein n=1 Tax=Dendrothele bispora (strain CBS 962.96) TaxID=1314807 RepID=A0A4S8LKC2_DENBC|nr:WD40 repeat-like protein [Dendrothele bispora CBS 962.96]
MRVSKICMKVLTSELKFNICELETSCLKNSDVVEYPIDQRVAKFISLRLQYSCLYWSNHVNTCASNSQVNSDLKEKVLMFGTQKWLIYWIECLSLMGKLQQYTESFENARKWAEEHDVTINKSTAHLYVSALAIASSLQQVDGFQILKKHLKKVVKIEKQGQLRKWLGAVKIMHCSSHISCVAYSPNGRHIVAGIYDKSVRIWDSQTGQPVGQPLQGHTSQVNSVAYSPDSRHIVSGSDDKTRVRIWDSQTGQPVGQPLQGHTAWVRSVAYSPDSRHIVSGSDDKTVRIWDSQTGQPVGQPLQGTAWVRSVACSPDSRHIVSGSDDHTIRIWDSQTGQPVGQPLQGHTGGVLSVAYSPDSRYIVSGSFDNTVRVWDSQIVQRMGRPLQSHTAPGRPVAYHPDSNGLELSSSADILTTFQSNLLRQDVSHVHSPPDHSCGIDSEGWLHSLQCPSDQILWLPQQLRGCFQDTRQVLTIPPDAEKAAIKVDWSNFAFGQQWTETWADD